MVGRVVGGFFPMAIGRIRRGHEHADPKANDRTARPVLCNRPYRIGFRAAIAIRRICFAYDSGGAEWNFPEYLA